MDTALCSAEATGHEKVIAAATISPQSAPKIAEIEIAPRPRSESRMKRNKAMKKQRRQKRTGSAGYTASYAIKHARWAEMDRKRKTPREDAV